jgi:hypothetical protein
MCHLKITEARLKTINKYNKKVKTLFTYRNVLQCGASTHIASKCNYFWRNTSQGHTASSLIGTTKTGKNNYDLYSPGCYYDPRSEHGLSSH